jgi:hypothetical protein
VRVPASVMWAKFEALAEGARIASGELWPKGKTSGRRRQKPTASKRRRRG